MANERPIRPTSRDVAALAGVAQSTVSYVMSGKRSIAPETARKIHDAMRQLNYHPHTGARRLRTNKTQVLALVVKLDEWIDAVETAPYIKGIIDSAREFDYDVVLSTLSGGKDELERLSSRQICDAIILMDVSENDPRAKAAVNLPVPTVLMGRTDPTCPLDCVDFDTATAAQLLVKELAQTGHTHLKVVGEDTTDPNSFIFVEKFHEGLAQVSARYGLDLLVVERHGASYSKFAEVAGQLLPNPGEKAAIVTRNPRLSDWVVRYLQSKNVALGKDVSLVSYCPDEVAVSYPVPITNVSGSISDLCHSVVELVLKRLEVPEMAVQSLLIRPNPVTRRDSSMKE